MSTIETKVSKTAWKCITSIWDTHVYQFYVKMVELCEISKTVSEDIEIIDKATGF